MNIKDIREYAEDGYHIHPKLVIELIDRLEAAEKEVSRLEWIISLHPSIDPSVIAIKESK